MHSVSSPSALPSHLPVHATGGRTLAIGVAATAAMWGISYIAIMLQPGLIAGEFIFAAIIGIVLAAGFIAGANSAPGKSAILAAMAVGLTTAILNLLIIGSLLTNPETSKLQPGAMLWILGDLLATPLLAGVGGLFGGMGRKAAQPARNWLNSLTWSASLTIFLLLITGGLVTGMEAGMAVFDWPNTFGHNMFLFPLSQMKGGVYFEHAHRLYGSLVGLTTILLMLSLFMYDKRKWIRWLGVSLFFAVCIQGVLGGTRVLESSTTLAIAHGIFAQLVFATLVCLTAFTSSTWLAHWHAGDSMLAKSDRIGSKHLFRLVAVQLVLGALYRHLNDKPVPTPVIHSILGLHILAATGVLAGGILIGARAWSQRNTVIPETFSDDEHRAISAAMQWRGKLGMALMALISAQVMLGVISLVLVISRNTAGSKIIPASEIAFTSAHHGVGALILAVSALLMVWSRRLSTSSPSLDSNRTVFIETMAQSAPAPTGSLTG
ncbi:MAG TPA: COX15/CtaA family protein [Phycisphaerales bacterium]|nr:COX15/CtaA family protein [Phycisphaerales bacterium]